MLKTDMELRRQMGMAKVRKAIKQHGGCTLMSAGITSMVAGITGKASFDAGARLFEISPNGIALDIGFAGLTRRADALRFSYQIPLEDLTRRVAGFRAVMGDEVFVTVACAGLWTYLMPCPFTDDDARRLALAGADCLHVHKCSVEDYASIVEIAHRNGLLVECYIGYPEEVDPSDHARFIAVPAPTVDDVAKCVRELEGVGVDLIGLMTSHFYEELGNEIAPEVRDRIQALVQTATHPTILEGGITPSNYHVYKATGANILIIGIAFDNLCADVIRRAVHDLVG